jgi:hypothetical protein
VPIFTGAIDSMNVTNLLPPTAAYSGVDGDWSVGGWTLFLGGLYIAAWSTYGFETAVCYTAELKDPKRDTFRAIFYSGLLCAVFFFLIPFSFQGVSGHGRHAGHRHRRRHRRGRGAGQHDRRRAGDYPDLRDPDDSALFMAIMTALAGSSRTLYQGSKRWLAAEIPGTVNSHGRAVQSDVDRLCLQRHPAGAGVGRGRLFLCAGHFERRLHPVQLPEPERRLDSPHRFSAHIERPWKAPTWLIGINTLLAFVNALFLGAGAKVWGYENALWSGLVFASFIIPVFWYRHYLKDGGKFPKEAYDDLGLKEGDLGERKAGMLPYLALVAGAAWSCGPTGSSFCLPDGGPTDHRMSKGLLGGPFFMKCFPWQEI